jgi:hypothetical protein
VPFLSVAVAGWLADLVVRFKPRERTVMAALLLVCLIPCVAMVRSVGRSNRGQLAQVQYVLDRSQAGDRVYDPSRNVNVFRPDAHYFWFLVRPGVSLAGHVANGRYADYETCRLFESVQPTIVSQRSRELEGCGAMPLYQPTPFVGLFVRTPKS